MKAGLKRALAHVLSIGGGCRLARPRHGGIASIIGLHAVRPDVAEDLVESRVSTLTPESLGRTLAFMQARGYRFVTLRRLHERLDAGGAGERLACLTFDDGWRDNLVHALPICRRFAAPMTVMPTTGFLDRTASMWWLGLERLLLQSEPIRLELEDTRLDLPLGTSRRRARVYRTLWPLFFRADPKRLDALDRALFRPRGIDIAALTEAHALSWDEARALHASGLVAFGSHGVRHLNLKRQAIDVARFEIAESRARIEAMLEVEVGHFAYPYGSAGAREAELVAEAGYLGAVTTRSGNIMPAHRDHPFRLPRLPLDGPAPDAAMIEALTSGALPALANRLRPVVV